MLVLPPFLRSHTIVGAIHCWCDPGVPETYLGISLILRTWSVHSEKRTFLTWLPEGLGWRRSYCFCYLLPDLGNLASKLLQSRTLLYSFGGDGDVRPHADGIVRSQRC